MIRVGCRSKWRHADGERRKYYCWEVSPGWWCAGWTNQFGTQIRLWHLIGYSLYIVIYITKQKQTKGRQFIKSSSYTISWFTVYRRGKLGIVGTRVMCRNFKNTNSHSPWSVGRTFLTAYARVIDNRHNTFSSSTVEKYNQPMCSIQCDLVGQYDT